MAKKGKKSKGTYVRRTLAERVLAFYKSHPGSWVSGYWSRLQNPGTPEERVCYCLSGGACAVTRGGFEPGYVSSCGTAVPGRLTAKGRRAGGRLALELGFVPEYDEPASKETMVSDAEDLLIAWNDEDGRTIDEVMHRLELAARRARYARARRAA